MSAWLTIQFHNYPNLPNQQLAFLSEKLKAQRITKDSYVDHYKQIIPKTILVDTVSNQPVNISPGSVSTNQVFEYLVLDTGNQIEDYLINILLKKINQPLINSNDANIKTRVLFSMLEEKESSFEENLNFDALILSYAVNKIYSFAQSNSTGIEDWIHSIKMISFFSKHLESRTEEIIKKAEHNKFEATKDALTLFDLYGKLTFLPIDQSWLFQRTYKLLYLLPSSRLSLSGLRLKIAVQDSYIKNNLSPRLEITELSETAETLESKLNQFKINDIEYVKWFKKYKESILFQNYPKLANQQLNFLSEKVKGQSITRETYVDHVKQIIPEIILEDTASNQITNVNTGNVSAAQTFESLTLDAGAQFEDYLLNILLKKINLPSINSNDANINTKLLFRVLEENESSFEEHLNFDSLILRYAVNKIYSFAQNNTSGLEDWLQSINMITFFSKHLDLRVAMVLKKAESNKVEAIKDALTIFDLYGQLAFLPIDQSWLVQRTYKLLYLVPSNQLNLSGLRLKLTIQSSYMKNSQSPCLEINDLFETAETLANKINQFRTFDVEYMRWFDLFNIYVERFVSLEANLDVTVTIIDKRQSINEIVSRNLIRALRQNLKITNELQVFHPVFQIYLNRAVANLASEGVLPTPIESNKSFDDYLADGIDSLRKRYGVNLDTAQDSSLALQYQTLFFKIELGKFYLQSKNNISITPSIEQLRLSHDDYLKLRNYLEQALFIRNYKIPFDPNKPMIPRLQGKVMVFDSGVKTIKEFLNQSGSNTDVLTFSKPGKLYVPPGIYLADSAVTLTFDEIEFHPLSMIYTQGNSLEIQAKSIVNAWIDTSGADQTNDNLPPPIDGERACLQGVAIPYDHNELLKRLLDSSFIVSQPGFLEARREHYFAEVFRCVDGPRAGKPPSTPIIADNGTNAGNILLNGNTTYGIFVSFGGNGENGFSGANSPNCIEDEYHQVGTYNVSAGKGGNGGAAGSGATIILNSQKVFLTFINSVAGNPGIGGSPGQCGPPLEPFYSGEVGARGMSYHLNTKLVY
jgi:hypothetical protein